MNTLDLRPPHLLLIKEGFRGLAPQASAIPGFATARLWKYIFHSSTTSCARTSTSWNHLRFRHYGAARRAQRVIGGGKLGSCKLRWRSHGGKAGRVLRAAAEPGNASSVGNMICQRWDRRQ